MQLGTILSASKEAHSIKLTINAFYSVDSISFTSLKGTLNNYKIIKRKAEKPIQKHNKSINHYLGIKKKVQADDLAS